MAAASLAHQLPAAGRHALGMRGQPPSRRLAAPTRPLPSRAAGRRVGVQVMSCWKCVQQGGGRAGAAAIVAMGANRGAQQGGGGASFAARAGGPGGGESAETEEGEAISAPDASPGKSNTGAHAGGGSGGEEGEEESTLVKVAVAMLKFYKREISPLLPMACRYVPTCSMYAVESYKEFGFGKGTVLTAWRLLRCSPVGGRGYDPPEWPPVKWPGGNY